MPVYLRVSVCTYVCVFLCPRTHVCTSVPVCTSIWECEGLGCKSLVCLRVSTRVNGVCVSTCPFPYGNLYFLTLCFSKMDLFDTRVPSPSFPYRTTSTRPGPEGPSPRIPSQSRSLRLPDPRPSRPLRWVSTMGEVPHPRLPKDPVRPEPTSGTSILTSEGTSRRVPQWSVGEGLSSPLPVLY